MKKLTLLLAFIFLFVGAFACSETPPPETGDGGGDNPPTYEDYYDIDLETGFSLKKTRNDDGTYQSGAGTFVKADGEVFGKSDVYAFTCSGWNGELQVSETALKTHNEHAVGETAEQTRAHLTEKGYQYVAIDFALDENASVGIYTYLPIRVEMKGELGGITVKDGAVVSGAGNYISEFADRFKIYKGGYSVHSAIELEAGAWYTAVVQLQLDSEQSLQGLDSWVNVSLTNGNGGTIYIAGGRFYTNTTFEEDYGSLGKIEPEPLADYYEFGADEMIDIKNVSGCYYQTVGEIYGKSETYTHIGNGWSTEISVKETAFVAGSSIYHNSAQAARASCVAKGYAYVALTFALSDGAAISVTGIIPSTGANNTMTGGLNFTDGAALAFRPAVDTDDEKAFFKVYSNGAEVNIGDTVSDGVWYTVVVKTLIDTSNNSMGDTTWLNISFGASGNQKEIYVAGVRYYTNDTFKTDYVSNAQ